jgi:CxxC motif-containing protein (DUF1111 family)
MKPITRRAALALAVGLALAQASLVSSQSFSPSRARDPGVRGGPAGAGGPIAGLTPREVEFFIAGLDEFSEAEEADEGLGPTLNLDSCGGCHAQPAIGGSSPAINPQVAFARKLGARNAIPPFIRENGPVREARFVRNADGSPDGGVHALFTIAGRSDARGCSLAQPDFAAQLAARNVALRIPTPLFGAGLIELIPDDTILANGAASAAAGAAFGIRGRANFSVSGRAVSGQANANGNDGTVARFGWKAQNKSLLLFSGEAYNVEMGITSELFPTERDETAGCQFAPTPNDVLNTEARTPLDAVGAIDKFALFQRFLAPPEPSRTAPGGSASIERGRTQFSSVGCALCHTPTLRTGNTAVAALRNREANLYSDLLVHDMGPGLADGVSQGQAGGRDFRTAPLWGLGKRIFFLHDGRTTDLLEAIQAHRSGSRQSGDASEANEVVSRFNGLPEGAKQDVLNFLRSL